MRGREGGRIEEERLKGGKGKEGDTEKELLILGEREGGSEAGKGMWPSEGKGGREGFMEQNICFVIRLL